MGSEPGMIRSELRLLPHDPSWAEWFVQEATRLREALGPLSLHIEHVGSTAIPDLVAKPIVDICVVIARTDDFEACVGPLTDLGYRYRGQHGDDVLRRYFVLERGRKRIAQLHLYTVDAPAWRAQVRFRNLLHVKPDLREAYAREKVRAAEAVEWDKGEYSLQKGTFIEALLKTEGLT